MLVDDLNVRRALLRPDEADAPLIVDPDGMLPGTFAPQLLKVISGQKTQVLDNHGCVQRREHCPGSLDQIRGKTLAETVSERSGGELPLSAHDHRFMYHSVIHLAIAGVRVQARPVLLISRQV